MNKLKYFYQIINEHPNKVVLFGTILFFLCDYAGNIVLNHYELKKINISYKNNLDESKKDDNYRISKIIESFYERADKIGVNIEIQEVDFGFMDQKITEKGAKLGVCYHSDILNLGPRTAKIRLNSNIIYDQAALVTTIYHELGHCLLGLEHNNKMKEFPNVPESLMYSTDYQGDYYSFNHLDDYSKELFYTYIDGGSKTPLNIHGIMMNYIKNSITNPFVKTKELTKTVFNEPGFKKETYKNLMMHMFMIVFQCTLIYCLFTTIKEFLCKMFLDEKEFKNISIA